MTVFEKYNGILEKLYAVMNRTTGAMRFQWYCKAMECKRKMLAMTLEELQMVIE